MRSVFEVFNRTSGILFATRDAAKKAADAFPNTVVVTVSERPVHGSKELVDDIIHKILCYANACWRVGKAVGDSNAKIPAMRPDPKPRIPGYMTLSDPECAQEGYRQGYEDGHEAGWNACIAAMRELYAKPQDASEDLDCADALLEKIKTLLGEPPAN